MNSRFSSFAMKPRTVSLLLATAALLALLVLSGWRPFDRGTWWMEVAPVLIVLPLLFYTYGRFPLTTLLYLCIFLHSCILMAGGAYTFARVPLGFDVQQWLHLGRNPYDKLGHFAQGFVPGIAAREVLIRGNYINGRGMLAFLVVCIVMAVSATYELVEWGAALALGQGADEFLGTQGDPFDTQSDMFCALLGVSVALIVFSRWHDRQITKLASVAA